MEDTLATQIAGVAVLDEPVRRSLYLYVARQADAVSRDEAADATGTSRENAAFHLDRLVEAGLLEASYRRLGGRTGPGAGRPSKLYRRSHRELSVTVPARRY
ncbi:MAG TPA: helix-turn-helix domain-containing protein, partial [Candidatus Limnocylindria bacterium]|nr:helix-turn-helix domain-containing protein [Candidatus Limnocylindria bacterium]